MVLAAIRNEANDAQAEVQKEHHPTGWCPFYVGATYLLCPTSVRYRGTKASLTDLSRDGAGGIPNNVVQKQNPYDFRHRGFVLALPIFPGRLQPSIVGRSELNFRVRDGNGWTLALISTNYLCHRVAPKTTCIISTGSCLVKTLVTRTGFEPMLKA